MDFVNGKSFHKNWDKRVKKWEDSTSTLLPIADIRAAIDKEFNFPFEGRKAGAMRIYFIRSIMLCGKSSVQGYPCTTCHFGIKISIAFHAAATEHVIYSR